MSNKEIIGNNIKNLRLELGLTQEELSEKLDISSNYLSQIESGKRGINVNNIINMCKTLECSPTYIFKDTVEDFENIQQQFESLSPRDKSIIKKLIESLIDT